MPEPSEGQSQEVQGLLRRRISPQLYHRITLVALALLATIVVTGAAVRLSGSGLGCPDWPTCAENRVVAPLEFHAQIEFINRVFTGIVGVAVILAVLASLIRTPRRRDLTVLSLLLVLGVVAEAVLGGFTVRHRLDPKFVMAHFLLSMLLVWAAVVLHHRAGQPDGPARPVLHRDYVILARLMLILAGVTLFIGTIVTGSGPHGGDENVHRLGFAPHAITKAHGVAVWLLIMVAAITAWRIHVVGASQTLVRKAEAVMAILLVQGAIGYFQYATGLPAGLVLLHIVGATAAWIAIIRLNLALFERWGDLGLAAYDQHDDGDLGGVARFVTTQEPRPQAPQPQESQPKDAPDIGRE